MDLGNCSTEFLLLGFRNLSNYKVPLFIMFFVFYIAILIGNLLIITLVSISHSLNSPMYYFLAHLACSDISISTIVIPKMLFVVLKDRETITFIGCISQLYLFGSSAITECFLLTVMSYDRYLAICKPLHYITIMDISLRRHLTAWSWMLAFILTLITVPQIYQLQFCGPNIIDHFVCDPAPLLELSCSDTSFIELQNLILGLPVTFLPFGFIVTTYVCIFLSILKITSTFGRQKAFSTCSSHLSIVCIYYVTLVTLYVLPSKGHSYNLTKIQFLLYTMVTPLINPLIYSLRNQDVRTVLKIVFCQKKHYKGH
ncbi:olfactory receptor 11A1-like [Bombina bombina]|uniref:olfactory receptor 11A1-like n=1 Tax=Bombina bombina TaxID=8345 RepID=UPI00235AD4B0|nr:olfactory receptor 11A1-like [Bombina bombina]